MYDTENGLIKLTLYGIQSALRHASSLSSYHYAPEYHADVVFFSARASGAHRLRSIPPITDRTLYIPIVHHARSHPPSSPSNSSPFPSRPPASLFFSVPLLHNVRHLQRPPLRLLLRLGPVLHRKLHNEARDAHLLLPQFRAAATCTGE